MVLGTIVPKAPASVNWPAVRAWAEIHYPDAYLNFDQFRHYYLRQFLVSQRRTEVA